MAAEQINDWEERRPVGKKGSRVQDPDLTFGKRSAELGEETGLSDSGFSNHGDDLPVLIQYGPEAVLQKGNLGFTTDER